MYWKMHMTQGRKTKINVIQFHSSNGFIYLWLILIPCSVIINFYKYFLSFFIPGTALDVWNHYSKIGTYWIFMQWDNMTHDHDFWSLLTKTRLMYETNNCISKYIMKWRMLRQYQIYIYNTAVNMMVMWHALWWLGSLTRSCIHMFGHSLGKSAGKWRRVLPVVKNVTKTFTKNHEWWLITLYYVLEPKIDISIQILYFYVDSNYILTLIAKFMGPTSGPPGSCRPQMGPMLAPWTLLLGYACTNLRSDADLYFVWPDNTECYAGILWQRTSHNGVKYARRRIDTVDASYTAQYYTIS